MRTASCIRNTRKDQHDLGTTLMLRCVRNSVPFRPHWLNGQPSFWQMPAIRRLACESTAPEEP